MAAHPDHPDRTPMMTLMDSTFEHPSATFVGKQHGLVFDGSNWSNWWVIRCDQSFWEFLSFLFSCQIA